MSIKRGMLAMSLLAACGFGWWYYRAVLQVNRGLLEPDRKIVAEIHTPGQHVYTLDLHNDVFLEVALTQSSTDLKMALSGPGLREPYLLESVTAWGGSHWLYFHTGVTGRYFLTIRGKSLGRNTYQLVAHSAPATVPQRRAAEAQRLLVTALKRPSGQRERGLRLALEEATASKHRLMIAEVTACLATEAEACGASTAARSHYQQAALAYHSLGASYHAATTYTRLGKLVFSEDGTAAQAYFEAAHRSAVAAKDPAVIARVLSEQAEAQYQAGAFQEALSNYHAALAELGGDHPALRASILRDMAITYTASGRCDYARGYLQESLSYWTSVADPANTAWVQVELAWSYYAAKQYDRAIELLEQVLSQRDSYPRSYLPAIYDRLGSSYRESRQFERALRCYQKSLEGTEPGSVSRAHVLANMGELYAAFERSEEAIRAVDPAIETFGKAKQPLFLANALFIKGRALAQMGDPETSVELERSAALMIQQIRAQTTSPTSAYSFTAAYYPIYSRYVETLLALNQSHPGDTYQRKAFEFLESVRGMVPRARLSNLWLEEQQASGLKSQLEVLRAQIRDIEYHRQERDETTQEEQAANLLKLLEQAERLSHQVQAVESGNLADLPEQTLESVQRELLEGDSLLLSYYLGEKQSYVWAVGPSTCQGFQLPPAEAINHRVNQYLRQLSRPKRDPQSEAALAKWLSHCLLAPMGNLLDGKRLLIIKDGMLHGLPFAPLPDPSAEGERLIDSHACAVLPSATYGLLVHRLIASRKRPTRSALVVVDPVYSSWDTRFPQHLPRPKEVGPTYQRLPQTALEAAVIQSWRPDAMVLSGLAATKQNVLMHSMADVQLVHFGLHGVLHELHPSLSHVLLSRYDSEGRACDGVLSSFELAELNMPVELAILSGCKTALGKDYRSEGLWSLGRDIMAAGAARVLVSLWEVDDQATAQLMTAFYDALLGKNLPPAEALQQAQQSMLHSEFADPYYWAAFELQGDLYPLRDLEKPRTNQNPARVAMQPSP